LRNLWPGQVEHNNLHTSTTSVQDQTLITRGSTLE